MLRHFYEKIVFLQTNIYNITIEEFFMEDFKLHRYFLKDSVRKTIDFRATDQNRGVSIPPLGGTG